MRAALIGFIAALIGTLAAFAPALAAADDATPPERAALEQVLSEPEFQPRDYSPSWWEQMKAQALAWAQEKLEKLRRSLKRWADDVDLSNRMPRFLVDFFEFIAGIGAFLVSSIARLFYLGVAVAALYLIYRWRAPIRKLLRAISKREDDAVAFETPAGAPPDLARLLAEGKLRELLAALRAAMRREAERFQRRGESLTDRELIGRTPPVYSGRSLLARVLERFEDAAFSTSMPDTKSIEELLAEFQSHEAKRRS